MNIEKYTQNAQGAVVDSQNLAIEYGHQMLDGEHILMALLKQNDGLIPKLLKNMNVDVDSLTSDVDAELNKLPKVSGGADNMYSTRRFNKILMDAENNAEQFKDEYVSLSTFSLHCLARKTLLQASSLQSTE